MKFNNSHPALEQQARDFEPVFKSAAGSLAHDLKLYPFLFNLAASINEIEVDDVPVISIAGAQGTGKSTLAGLLALILRESFGRDTGVVSLDDFYLSKAEREKLAEEVHPLLAKRGVPGTHDLAMMESVIRDLRSGLSAEIPVFEKARDDRREEPELQAPVSVILCEGWCWGAKPQTARDLEAPVNELERLEDVDGEWRSWVNGKLREYQPLFNSDGSVYLKAPSLEAVLRWRWQQEEELAASEPGASRLMTKAGIETFIAGFERLTRWMMESEPERVDVCVNLDENHWIDSIS